MVTSMGLDLDLWSRIKVRDAFRQSGGPKGGGPNEDVAPVPADRGESRNHALVGDEGHNREEQFGRETIGKRSVHRGRVAECQFKRSNMKVSG